MALSLEAGRSINEAHSRQTVRSAPIGLIEELTPAQREWARCRHWIEDSLASSFDTIESIERGVASGKLIFWAGPDCAAITRLDIYKNVRVLTIVHAGGNLANLLDLGKVDLVRAAQLLNCDYICVHSPEHLIPKLEAVGFSPDFTVMLKRVVAKADGAAS